MPKKFARLKLLLLVGVGGDFIVLRGFCVSSLSVKGIGTPHD